MSIVRRAALAATSLVLAAAVLPSTAEAQGYPIDPDEYVEVGMISIDDGHTLDYANFLAGQWRRQQDYARQQGWITRYEILTNEYKRAGEPDIYLMTWFPSFADKAEEKRRRDAYQAYMKMNDAQLEAGSAERAKYRHQMGSMLLRGWTWKK